MNCPMHIQSPLGTVRATATYQLRLSDFGGTVDRGSHQVSFEELPGVRGFTQDDGHLVCTEDTSAELRQCLELGSTCLRVTPV